MVHIIDGKVHPGHKDNVGKDGSYTRQPTVFRGVIEVGGEFEPEAGRYHLYVSPACGWSHRVMLLRALKKLESIISVSIIHPKRHDDGGWHFQSDVNEDGVLAEVPDPKYPECLPDPVYGAARLHEVYTTSHPSYTGNVTVPVLFDTKTKRIVSNESEVIMRNLNTAFDSLGDGTVASFYPTELQKEIDEVNEVVYSGLSNAVCELSRHPSSSWLPHLIGVSPSRLVAFLIGAAATSYENWALQCARCYLRHAAGRGIAMTTRTLTHSSTLPLPARPSGPVVADRAGFAKSQELYETECKTVFATLGDLEKRLGVSRYLVGDTVTEADLRLFVTLVRFDPVYYGHFKVRCDQNIGLAFAFASQWVHTARAPFSNRRKSAV